MAARTAPSAETSEAAEARESGPVPTSQFGRLARVARLAARTGANRLRDGDSATVAAESAKTLGRMRGIAAKLGQMTAYIDGLVPEERQTGYERHMGRLLTNTSESASDEIRECVEQELGAPIDRLFADFEDAPLASASIGQVHRATLHDGTRVAVKVQHPLIAQALDADLRNMAVFEGFMGLFGTRRAHTKALFEEVSRRFREELDYRIEAKHIDVFRAVHAGDPQIVIPRVIGARSSERVLTTELVFGNTFADACAASEEARAAWSRTLWRFVFRGSVLGGRFNADPHPGNYLFQDDARIAFVDFGCVETMTPARKAVGRGLHKSALAGDEVAFREYAAQLLAANGGIYERNATAYVRRCFEPLFASPFRFRRSFVAGLTGQLRSLASAATRDGSFRTLPEGLFFFHRLQFGFYSVLARLDVEVDYAAEEHAFLAPFL